MKIGIIAANNTRYSPYIFFYTEILERLGMDYEILVPNRNANMEEKNERVCVLPWKGNVHVASAYLAYSRAVKRHIKKNNYDGLVVLTGNNAAFLGHWLKRKYKRKYIVDIRDYTHENIKPYYWLEKMAVRNSLLNVLSSSRFRTFLPSAEYVVCHNMTTTQLIDRRFEKKKASPIEIGYVGALSYFSQCRRLMELVARDERFSFSFYGSSAQEERFRKFAETLQCDRIRFFGAYDNSAKPQIVQKIDILFNAYGSGVPLLDYALSNKLYDAMAYHKPILTCPGTYMDELSGVLSISIDLDEIQSLDSIYERYCSLDEALVDKYASESHKNFIVENETTKEIIERRLRSLMT